ncbi:MAG: sulfur oxidation c-type cytochrome SoxX [Ramlibacter sp.]
MKLKQRHLVIAAFAAAAVAGCASLPGSAELDRITAETVKTSFRNEGAVKIDRLAQDDANRECSAAQVEGRPLAPERAKAIEAANLKTIKWPSDGKFLGDWKQGEDIAQNGRGLTWTDDAKVAIGGNCYNCHQITKEEISFGTIGPSLYQYGKLRGVADPNSAAARPVVEYTWGKIWNSRAYAACSNMPRAGHSGILSEQQVKHVVALLLDPQSPVNK